MAKLDWMMPETDGPEICRRIRQETAVAQPYLVLLTSEESAQSTVEGLRARADDQVTKSCDAMVLRVRVDVGITVLEVQSNLAGRVKELEKALANVKRLQCMRPICSYFKRIRNDSNYW